jgi:uncharacterized protein (DUF305 family)
MTQKYVPLLAALLLAASALHAADDPKEKGHEHKAAESAAMSSAGSKAVHDAMMKGMSGMHGMKMTGDTDHDFAMMMIQHHQQAIDMARAELKHGKDAEVRKKAQEIVEASEKDIADLKKWQSGHQAKSQR